MRYYKGLLYYIINVRIKINYFEKKKQDCKEYEYASSMCNFF